MSITKPIMNLDEVEFDDVEENGLYTSKRGTVAAYFSSAQPLPAVVARSPFQFRYEPGEA